MTGTSTLARLLSPVDPTEVVEHPLAAPASAPTDSEHALTGAATSATEDDWVVVFVPVVES